MRSTEPALPKETPQDELRRERIAIMVIEGVTVEEAEAYCDSKPSLYGFDTKKAKQEFFSYAHSSKEAL